MFFFPDHKPETPKGKERLSGFLSYACRARSSALRFSLSSSGGLALEVISPNSKKAKSAFPDFRLMLVGQDRPASAFLCTKGRAFGVSPLVVMDYSKSTAPRKSDPVGCGLKFLTLLLPARSGVEWASGTQGASSWMISWAFLYISLRLS